MSFTWAFAGAEPYVWSTPPDDVDPQTVSDDWAPRLAITPDGTVWCAWMGLDPTQLDEEVFFSRWNGLAWDPPATANPPNQTDDRFPQLAVSASGSLWCLYVTPNATGAYSGLVSHWTGTSWSYPDTVWKDGARHDEYQVAPVSDSEAWLARAGMVGATYDVFLYHTVAGVTDPPFHYVEPDSNEMYPGIAVDGDGVPWAAWSQIPPLSPPNSQIRVTKYVSGAWQPPETLPQPLGIIGLYFLAAPPSEKWIACLAADPVNGYQDLAAWAVHWNGTGWDPAVRVSDPVTSNDSTQFNISATRNPSRPPRIIWGRANKHNYTRTDMLTSAWDGSGWTPPALVGTLADSTYVMYPDIADRGTDSIWVAYMAQPGVSPLWHVLTAHTVPVTTAVSSIEFSAARDQQSVKVMWSLQLDPRSIRLLRILRAPGEFGPAQQEAPATAAVVGAVDYPQATQGALVDAAASGPVSYWIEAVRNDAAPLWAGPVEVMVGAPSVNRLVSAAPNPFTGTVAIAGVSGPQRPVAVEIYDIAGRLIRVIALPSGGGAAADRGFSVRWDGMAGDGRAAASGVYLARLRTSGSASSSSLRLLLLK